MANILLAEDDPSMSRFLATALERAGHSVLACPDGLCALSVLEKNDVAYDLLLTDIVMPGMDGIELSQKATALHPDLKILFISGFSAVEHGAENNDAPFLPKPFHLKDLIAQIETILAAR